MKKLFSIILLASILFAGCDQQKDITTSEDLILGAIYNLSGSQSALDLPSSRGAQLAIEQINAQGGIDGQNVRLILEDGQTDTDVLKTKVNDMLAEYPEVLAFMGLSDTDQVLAAAEPAGNRGRVFLTSGATSPELPQQIEDYLFMACFGDNVQAAAAAEYAYDELGARSAAIVYDSSAIYTRLLQEYFVDRFEELGGKIMAVEPYTDGELDTAVQAIPSSDMIFFSALPQDAPTGVQKMRQAGITAPIFGGDAYDEPAAWQSFTSLSEVFFTTHAYLGTDNPSSEVQAFRQAYQEAYHEAPNAFAALGYDAAQLLIEAIKTADKPTPENVRAALSGIQGFSGVTGTISFDQDSRIPKKSVTIMEIENGEQEFVIDLVPHKIPKP